MFTRPDMSRRKQSNPKPLKRQSEDENLHLPAGILQMLANKTDEEPSVYSVIAIPRGSSFGPFKGMVVTDSDEKENDATVELNKLDGSKIGMKLETGEGSWLKHVTTTCTAEVGSNLKVFIQGTNIWAEVTEDIDSAQPLVALYDDGMKADDRPIQEVSPPEPQPEPSHSPGPPPEKDLMSVPAVLANGPKQLHPLIYGCMFCGVRFSNNDTLEAHQSYYCGGVKSQVTMADNTTEQHEQTLTNNGTTDHKVAQQQSSCQVPPHVAVKEEPADSVEAMTEESLEATVQANLHNALKSKQLKRELENSQQLELAAKGGNSDVQPPERKSAKLSRLQHKCQLCTYSSGRISSMKRHVMNHHPELLATDQEETAYCKECEIQFSSVKTLLAHKEHYCARRQQERQRTSSSVDTCDNSSTSQSPVLSQTSPPQMVGAMPTNVAASLLEAATHHLSKTTPMSSAVSLSIDNTNIQTQFIISAPMTSPDGGKLRLAVPTVIMQPVIAAPNTVQAHQNSTTAAMSRTPRGNSMFQDEPLDLSKKSKSVDLDRSSHHSPGASNKTATRNSSLIPSDGATKPLPQGVSKCLECNIVFYKHENYLIHKEHYCSSRHRRSTTKRIAPEVNKYDPVDDVPPNHYQQQHSPNRQNDIRHVRKTSNSSEGDESSSSKLSQHLSALRFACVPCNIRFSSSNTLLAHTQHYCPHSFSRPRPSNGEVNEERENNVDDAHDECLDAYPCKNCNKAFPSARLLKVHACEAMAHQAIVLRCMYCDYIATSENRLSEHLKTHAPQRIFKCTVCGYRGNTIRGMRMHGKLHVDSGDAFTDENIVCFEEPPILPITTPVDQQQQQQSKKPSELSENDLIRLKNEPYKRRRSRKSYEKSEHMTPRKIFTCERCNIDFTDKGRFKLHLLAHSDDTTDLVRELRGPNSALTDRFHRNEIAVSKGSEHIKSILFGKSDQVPNNVTTVAAPLKEQEFKCPTAPQAATNGTYIIPSAPQSPRILNSDVRIKEEPVDYGYEAVTRNTNERDTHDHRVNGVHIEAARDINSSAGFDNQRSVITSASIVNTHAQGNNVMKSTSPEMVTGESNGICADDLGGRYCQRCKISFRYFSSYLAHKKHYCQTHPADGPVSPVRSPSMIQHGSEDNRPTLY